MRPIGPLGKIERHWIREENERLVAATSADCQTCDVTPAAHRGATRSPSMQAPRLSAEAEIRSVARHRRVSCESSVACGGVGSCVSRRRLKFGRRLTGCVKPCSTGWRPACRARGASTFSPGVGRLASSPSRGAPRTLPSWSATPLRLVSCGRVFPSGAPRARMWSTVTLFDFSGAPGVLATSCSSTRPLTPIF